MRLSSRRLAAPMALLSLAAIASAAPRGSRLLLARDWPARSPVDAVVEALASSGVPLAPGARLVPEAELPMAGGLTRLRLRQEIGGVPVFLGSQSVMTRDGVPVAVVLGDVADPGIPGPFLVDALQATTIAATAVDGDLPAVASREPGGGTGWSLVDVAGRSEPARASRTILPSGPVAAWRVELCERGDFTEWWCVLVDATSGDVRDRIPLTKHAAAMGRVFPRGYLRGSEMRDFVDADVHVDEDSPAGWIAVDLCEGNDVVAFEDRRGDGSVTPGLQVQGTGDPLVFDYPVSGVPAADVEAALTNAFWTGNAAHDWFRSLGFDEPWGALQSVNFGRGGVGNDPFRVYVQYQATDAVNVARNSNSVAVGADGGNAIVSLGLWDRSGELRDGAFDTGLIVHEYAHSVVVRLAGNDAACDDGLQPQALSEGWGDYFAAAFTGDTVIGAWVSGNDVTGLRTTRVDTSLYSFANLCNISSTTCVATENGEIWSGALWDLRTVLKRAVGDVEGAELADRLVVEGMKYTPCRPTYPDARDGILAAELALTNGVHHCAIWGVMAGRGIGWSTSTVGPDDRFPVPGYDVPGECASGASVDWERPRYGDDADARVTLADARAGLSPRSLRVTASSGDVETLGVDAAPGTSGLVRVAIVALRPGAAVPGDGLVQVVEGDVLTATCTDCPRAPQATATVSRALSVSVLSHQLSNESCHDDDSAANVTDFTNELPSLLDAGELATVSVTLGNGERFPLEDVRVHVSCDDPDVQVLPSTDVLVPRVRERMVNPRGFVVSLRALVAPSPAVAFGDVATLTFDVRARGLQGQATLRVDLAGDYQDERGVHSFGAVETFEPSSPTAASWLHFPAGGQPADEWAIRACGNGGGQAMTYTGAGCADYPDTPSAATLASPPIFDFSNRVVAVHPGAFEWWNDVDLGYDPSNGYCDSEEVVLYVTDNPNRPNYAAPRGDRNSATQGWVQWPGLGETRNTAGWERATPRNAVTSFYLSPMVLPNVRMAWVLFTDVYDPFDGAGCPLGAPDYVGGGYRLDDVSFTYDLARVVAAADTSCARICGVRTAFSIGPPSGARCAGDELTLSAEGSEAAGCAGALQYRFTGPGFDSGWQDQTIVLAPAASGNWSCNVRCAADTSCSQQVTIFDGTLDDSTAGRLIPSSLRARREGDDVVLAWRGTRAPVAYALFRGSAARNDEPSRRALLVDLAPWPPADTLRHASPNALTFRDAGAASDGTGLHFYRVVSRLPCAGTALDR